jgi:ABC-2 type transport system ATP-binding protein
VLILDEPTAGLDPEERVAMLKRIQLLSRSHGKAVLLCTHILSDVQSICDNVVILARGRVQVSERLATLSRPTSPSLEIRLLGGCGLFAEELRRRGVVAETPSNETVILQGTPEETARHAWEAARACRTGILSMTPSRTSLEEVFLKAVREEPAVA